MAKIPTTAATTRLDALGIAWRGHTYTHDPRSDQGYGLEAASALGLNPDQVFKTLIVSVVDHGLAVAVLPVASMLDLRAFAGVIGGKHADLATREAAERSTGYVQGGISPIGQRRPLPTVLNSSALGWETIFVSGGRRGFDIEVAPSDLLVATSGAHAAIVRGS